MCATGFEKVVSLARQRRKMTAPLVISPYRVNPAAQSAPLPPA